MNFRFHITQPLDDFVSLYMPYYMYKGIQMVSRAINCGSKETPHDEGTLLDLTNSKGHGFHMYRMNGTYILPVPAHMLHGGKHTDQIQGIRDAELQDDDVFICAYPKCGTHWVWEAVEMLRRGVVQSIPDVKETRQLEFIFKQGLEALQGPRIFNTHLPLRMLPRQVGERKIKCIQIKRNPKDVCVSFFHHFRNHMPQCGYEGDFSEFIEIFLDGKVPSGSYSEYLLDWKTEVAMTDGLPVHYMYYEDMKRNPVRCIEQVADFLGLARTNTLYEDIAQACSFQKMKTSNKMKKGLPFEHWKDGTTGTFYRKGEVGDWKNSFTVAKSERFDKIWNKAMKNSGISFTYSLT